MRCHGLGITGFGLDVGATRTPDALECHDHAVDRLEYVVQLQDLLRSIDVHLDPNRQVGGVAGRPLGDADHGVLAAGSGDQSLNHGITTVGSDNGTKLERSGKHMVFP